jgi:ABC-type transport system involved in cytochrome c biogenesis permease subunit
MKRLTQYAPWLAAGAAALVVLATLRPPAQKSPFDLVGFAHLPTLLEGRLQPLESVGRNSLLQIRARQTVHTDAGETLQAREWLAELLMKPEAADQRKVFRVDNLELRDMMKVAHEDKYFSYAQLEPSLDKLQEEAPKIGKIDEKQQTAFQRQVIKLYQAVLLYNRLKVSLHPRGSEDFAQELEQFQGLLAPARTAVAAQQSGQSYDTNVLRLVLAHLDEFKFMAEMAVPLMIPPPDPARDRDAWHNVGASLLTGQVEPAVKYYATMCSAYRAEDAVRFNAAVNDYRQWLSSHGLSKETKKVSSEFFFYRLAPFMNSLSMYFLAFLLVCVYWLKLTPWLRRTAGALVLVALLVHTFGLVYRMVLQGRPPVTNLYSSAIFIGWGGAILGLVLERFYKDGIGLMTSSVLGFTTLIIAHNLSVDGDTMIMLRAVLDTNFWLATHVTTVTLGYSSTFVAGFLALLYLVLGVFTPVLNAAKAKSLARMVYGIVCFATLFSFIGTILGGIWADQSWGRFWGWDPKENGALMIVIWNAIYLHARWGKLVSERVLMSLAVFGNVVTSFSWFGVNMLGVGLHAYGFMEKAFVYLILFDISQVIIMGLAFIPQQLWRSFREPTATKTRPELAEKLA